MVDTYKQIARKSREAVGRAPKFDVKYFTLKEVQVAIENNKYFSHACVELGLMKKGSKSPFNALRNLHKLINHFQLKRVKLGSNLVKTKLTKCPHCEKKFKINLVE
jgi:hypothetical protein